ncbi:unnamed protein product [Linum tenue]|uniref:Uncharacterized protein n=1 Tax=Linum tenue TaxID=586396 RepID=A0AAV0KLN4_9ROSI|nr:unnamed protein product [Linum tenue]
MQLRESIDKTKTFFQTTLLTLKSLLFGGYQKLPKPPFNNPFSCGTGFNPDHIADHEYYTNFCNELECDLEKVMKLKTTNHKPIMAPKETPAAPMKKPQKKQHKDEKSTSKRSKKLGGQEEEEQCSSKKQLKKKKMSNEESYALARKMKELEMIDVSDVEHVLDVEEALHYYSRLKSPVYLDIVDKFFTDMYQEFTIPHQASVASVNSSRRRLGSFRL